MLSHQNLQKLLPQWIVSAQLQQKRHYICMIRYFETESLCYTAEINTTLQISNAVLCSPQLLSCVQLFATLWTEACQAPLSMGILQARILELVAYPFSRGSSRPRNRGLLHRRWILYWPSYQGSPPACPVKAKEATQRPFKSHPRGEPSLCSHIPTSTDPAFWHFVSEHWIDT